MHFILHTAYLILLCQFCDSDARKSNLLKSIKKKIPDEEGIKWMPIRYWYEFVVLL